MPISAVTFDFWNTLYHDGGTDDDALMEIRLSALGDALRSCGLEAPRDRLLEAHRAGFQAYIAAWQAGRQYGAREQVEFVLTHFGGCSRDGVAERTALIIEESGAQADLRLLPGAAEVLPELVARGVRLGLISDTSITPGRVLVRFLERDGLLPCFSVLTFSDETGFPKPDPRMFRRTLAGLDTLPRDAVHVGDTPRSDIAGALEVGMTAVRFAAVNDLGGPPEPHAVIRDHRELRGLLADL